MNVLFQLKKRQMTRRDQLMTATNTTSLKKRSELALTSALFKLLFSKLRLIVKIESNEFILNFLSLDSLKKRTVSIRIRCDIFNDVAKLHTMKENDKKNRVENYVYLSYKSEKRSIHINKQFDEISVFTKIIYVEDFVILNEKDIAARNLVHQQKKKTIEWDRKFEEWTIKKLKWEYDLVLNLLIENVANVIWSQNKRNTTVIIQKLESEENEIIKYIISEFVKKDFRQDALKKISTKKKKRETDFIFAASVSKEISNEKQILHTIVKTNVVVTAFKLTFEFHKELTFFDEFSIFESHNELRSYNITIKENSSWDNNVRENSFSQFSKTQTHIEFTIIRYC